MRDDNFLTENNARHSWHPMAHPADSLANPPRIIAKAAGVEITDIEGNTVIDAVGGLWNVNLGYSCAPIKAAIAAQLDELPYYSTFRGTANAPQIELSHELTQFFAPEGMTRCFFTSGGSDSVETCLRLARQYHRITGQPERTKFFSLKKGYHGTHFGGASVNGNANFRRNYAPMLDGCFHLAAPYPYRSTLGTDDPAEMSRAIARQFEDEIAFQGADTIAALIMEPVLGAGGVIPPHPTLMPLLRAICDKHGILMIADEVITAFGRAGAWSGSRLWGVKPDMMCTAKAITNGYFPFGAALLNDKFAQAFESNKDGRATISHGYTYSGHPVGAAAALATLSELRRLDVAANAAVRGRELLVGLHELASRHEMVGDVRGQGLMCALELVSDRTKKTGISKDTMQTFQDATYDAGVMVRTSGANVIFSPPLILTADGVARILQATDKGLATAKAKA